MMGYWSWGMGFGWLFMLLFWGLVLVGVFALIRWTSEQPLGGNAARTKSALDILQERYARGEIQKEEYQEKKRELTA